MHLLTTLSVALLATTYGMRAKADTLNVGQDGLINATVNGHPAKLLVRGDWMSYPTLNPDATEKFGIRSNVFASTLGIQAVVGTTTIPGHTGKAKFLIDGRESNLRALWFDKPAASQLDGVVGPAGLAPSEIRLNTGVKVEHPTLSSVPIQVNNNKIGTQITIDQTPVFVMFNPLREHTIASAAAGQAISAMHGGKWTGSSHTETADFGIERPVRELALATPIEVGALRIQKMLVRDYSRVSGVTEDSTAQDAQDPSEVTLPAVTVTADTKSKIKPHYYLTLGRDVLGQCDSITFNKATNRIDLSCE